ncbi:hypothetical protein GDO81_014121 [Engystomops pustulosus]|uniref:TNFR-Cys domain-containing protein n=1 Tax=Engystomops pustulosus TaxID=76066 RepID=A0AAV7B877_ENGPU|nr:hypothetical protein GDO81_014121 [Engystomops pustulosus]
MDPVTSILLSGLLQILYIQTVLCDGCLKFAGSCCIQCNAGYFLPKKCGPCIPCPSKGYNERPTDRPYCDHCRRCEGIFLYKERCTSTSNAVCTCIPGKVCVDEKCTQCKSDRCQAGQQLQGQKCVDCPVGTFNTGAEHRCIPWKNCTAHGGVVIANGNRTSDVVCKEYLIKVTQSPSPPSAVSAVTTIPKPVVKQTEEEEGCSYHYPEEERGGENEPMTLVA